MKKALVTLGLALALLVGTMRLPEIIYIAALIALAAIVRLG